MAERVQENVRGELSKVRFVVQSIIHTREGQKTKLQGWKVIGRRSTLDCKSIFGAIGGNDGSS